MTKEEILNKAIYIQYPLTYGKYKEYIIDNRTIHKLPLPEEGEMFDEWKLNDNHYTSEYHRKYSIPLFCKLLKLEYNKNDFKLFEKYHDKYNLSILKPNREFKYEIYGYTRNEHFDNLTFNDIITNTLVNREITDYHKLYRYSHECSRLINKTLNNDRKLFISGDSQIIPDMSFLSCFFKEIWYFDNRKNKNLSDKWKHEKFSDVIIEMCHLPITDYTELNFK